MKKKDQSWFEMPMIKKRELNKDVWIPLRVSKSLIKEGSIFHTDYLSEYYKANSIAVPVEYKKQVEEDDLVDLNIHNGTPVYRNDDGKYFPSHIYDTYDDGKSSIHLVLIRGGNSLECESLILNPDIIIALNLKEEDGEWFSIDMGYEKVAYTEKNENNCITGIYINSKYLKEYLYLRNMALYVASYRSREQIVEETSHINWPEYNKQIETMSTWEGRILEKIEGRGFLGDTVVLHVGRTNIDFEEDVPDFKKDNKEDVVSDSWTVKPKGKKIYQIMGEFWKREWVDPNNESKFISNDNSSDIRFVSLADGTKESNDSLKESSKYLWFKPNVINNILDKRGSFLEWHTRDTGAITCSPSWGGVRFGINKLGYINVYAKDIAILPTWQQDIWAASNINPDGGVSKELLMAQMEAKPAGTHAPEEHIELAFKDLNKIIKNKFGITILNILDEEEFSNFHRFRVTSQKDLYNLAKDLYKIFGENLKKKEMKKIINPINKDQKKWGSLKLLEELLSKKIDPDMAYRLITPLWGLYTFRNVDAHVSVSSEDVEKAYIELNINKTEPFVLQGYSLIYKFVQSLANIIEIMDSSGNKQ